MAWKLTVWLLVLVMPATGAAGQETTPPGEASAQEQPLDPANMTVKQLLETTRRLLAEGEGARARPLLELVLQRDPANIDAMYILGEAGEIGGDREAARAYYNRIRQIDPFHFGANLGLGRIYNFHKIWRQATEYLRNAEKVAPPDRLADTQALLAMALRGQRQFAEALRVAEQAVNGAPQTFAPRMTLAEIYLDLGQFDEALGEAAQLVIIANAQARENPANTEALQRLRMAHDVRVRVLLAQHATLYELDERGNRVDQLVSGNEQKAAGLLNQIRYTTEAQAHLNRRIALHEVLMFAERAVQYAPKNVEYLYSLSLLYGETTQYDKAIATLQRILEIDPTHAAAKGHLQRLRAPLSSQPAAPAAEEPAEQSPTPGG